MPSTKLAQAAAEAKSFRPDLIAEIDRLVALCDRVAATSNDATLVDQSVIKMLERFSKRHDPSDRQALERMVVQIEDLAAGRALSNPDIRLVLLKVIAFLVFTAITIVLVFFYFRMSVNQG